MGIGLPAEAHSEGDRPLAALSRKLHQPVDGASIEAFRILLGVILFGGAVRFVALGWVEPVFLQPTFFFKYPGFSWIPDAPPWSFFVHYGLLAGLAGALALGLYCRFAAFAFALLFAFVQLIDLTNYLNHYYLAVLLCCLLGFLGTGKQGALQNVLMHRTPRVWSPLWHLYLLRLQVAVVYVYAGLAKLNHDWLIDAQPLKLWLASRTELPLLGAWFNTTWAAYAFSWAGFLYDSTVVVFLLWRRTRKVAFFVVLLFHGMTYALFNIGLFPFLMTAAATLFFEPDWPRRLFRRLGWPLTDTPARAGSLPTDGRSTSSSRATDTYWRSAVTASSRRLWRGFSSLRAATAAALVMAYVVLQVALPLRHFLYPGDVLWNERGMRLAWKVLVREKNGSITYEVRSHDGRRHWQVTPQRYLTWRQFSEMSGQPDMIWQLAHHVKAKFADLGHRDVSVHAEAWVSLNGAAPALLIDPHVDLASITTYSELAQATLPRQKSPPLSKRRLPTSS